MLKQFISKRIITIYFSFIVITWLEAIINPSLVSMIVASFEEKNLNSLWSALTLGIVGNSILLIGWAGKRYFYAKLVADFNIKLKSKIFKQFLYGENIKQEDILSDLENDVQQLENNYIEPSVIVLSSLGFTSVSILYALATNFWLGMFFILFYSIPALCSGLGSKKLDQLSKQKSQINQAYLSKLNNIIGGSRIIKNYQKQGSFFQKYCSQLEENVAQNVYYERQRTKNSILINSIDIFCSVFPIIIGGFMTYYGFLSGAKFIAIYLVSYNIGYQFQELSYYINTLKSSENLKTKYQHLLQASGEQQESTRTLFPIELKSISIKRGNKILFSNLSFQIREGEKVAIIGKSGSGKSTLLNLICGDLLPDLGDILFNGQALSKKQISERTAYILQESYCFDDLNLEENIALGTSIDQQKMKSILSKTNLLGLQGKVVKQGNLSGGEKQRIDIARSLYHDRQLILADEVKSNLDKENAKLIEEILFTIPQAVVEVIHHYTNESLEKYDKVIDLKGE